MAKNQKTVQSESTAVATSNEAAANSVIATRFVPGSFKLKKRVIVPTLSLQENVPHILRIDSPIIESTYIDPDPKKAKEKPADVCNVTDMQTGVNMLLLVPAVMKSALERDYMDNKKVKEGDIMVNRPVPGTERYVGLVFGVQKLIKRPGKRYHDIDLAELEESAEVE